MSRFATFGNDLYTGKRSIDFVGRQRIWYAISAGIIVLALVGIFGRGLNFGLEFRGGSEFRVPGVTHVQDFEQTGRQALSAQANGADVVVTKLGSNTIRVQTEKLTAVQTEAGKGELAKAFGVPADSIASSFVGASWGSTVSDKALQRAWWCSWSWSRWCWRRTSAPGRCPRPPWSRCCTTWSSPSASTPSPGSRSPRPRSSAS